MTAAPPYADRSQSATLTVSVVVPAYNSVETLPAALETALGQTVAPLEVLVVDDGSTDATAELAEGFGAPVRVLRKANGGTASARNLGVREARGEVLAFLDADDRYEPTHLEEIVEALASTPELDAVVTNALLVSPERSWRCGDYWPGHARRERLDISAPVIFCAVGIRRSVLEELGPFDSRFAILEDVEMWHRLLCRGYRVGYVDSPSYLYNVRTDSKAQSGRKLRGHSELLRINLSYALARSTPMRFRPRLVVRGLRHLRGALVTWARRI